MNACIAAFSPWISPLTHWMMRTAVREYKNGRENQSWCYFTQKKCSLLNRRNVLMEETMFSIRNCSECFWTSVIKLNITKSAMKQSNQLLKKLQNYIVTVLILHCFKKLFCDVLTLIMLRSGNIVLFWVLNSHFNKFLFVVVSPVPPLFLKPTVFGAVNCTLISHTTGWGLTENHQHSFAVQLLLSHDLGLITSPRPRM